MESNVKKLLSAMYENFAAVGMEPHEMDGNTVLVFPHLVSHPGLDRDEQAEQVQMLVENAIKVSGISASYTMQDSGKVEGGRKGWHQYHVEITVKKELKDP